jgi:hypothetical protein
MIKLIKTERGIDTLSFKPKLTCVIEVDIEQYMDDRVLGNDIYCNFGKEFFDQLALIK